MDHDAGMERVIAAFDKGWRAGCSLKIDPTDDFGSSERDLHMFWLDGFHAAQSRIDHDDGEICAREPESPLLCREEGAAGTHTLSHPVSLALRAAYSAEGHAPAHTKLADLLMRIA